MLKIEPCSAVDIPVTLEAGKIEAVPIMEEGPEMEYAGPTTSGPVQISEKAERIAPAEPQLDWPRKLAPERFRLPLA